MNSNFKNVGVFGILWVFTIQTVLAADPRSLLQTLKKNENLSPQSYIEVAQYVQKECLTSSTATALELQKPSQAEESVTEKDLSVTYQAYEKLRAESRNLHDRQVYGSEAIKTIMRTTSAATAPIPVANVFLSELNYYTEKVLDNALEEFDQSARQSAENFLKAKLSTLPESTMRDLDRIADSKNSPEKAKEEVMKVVSQWSKVVDEKITDPQDQRDTQAIVNGYLAQAALGQVAKEGAFRKAADAALQKDIDENRTQLTKLSGTFAIYAKTNQRQMQTIIQTQEEVLTGMRDLRRDVGSLNQQMGFVNDFMFSRMTTKEQLSALNRGMFPELKGKEREALEKRIELVKKRENFEKATTDFFNGANTLIGIASGLGLNKKFVAKATRAVEVGSKVASAVGSIMKGGLGGFLNAGGAIFSLFGGRPSAAERRHKQIMGKLDNIIESQNKLREGINTIIELQAHVLKGQQRIMEGIIQLSQQLESEFERVRKDIRDLRTDVLDGTELLLALMGLGSSTNCDVFVKNMGENDTASASENESELQIQERLLTRNPSTVFQSYEGFRAYFQQNENHIMGCFKGLTVTFESNKGLFALLKLKNSWNEKLIEQKGIAVKRDIIEKVERVKRFIEQVYSPLYEFAFSNVKGADGKAAGLELPVKRLYWSVQLPSETVEHSGSKQALIENKPLPTNLEFWENLSEPLSASAVTRTVGYLLNLNVYLPWIDSFEGGGFRTLEDVAQNGNNNAMVKSRTLLDGARQVIDLALAQEALLAGDGLLDALYVAWQLNRTAGVALPSEMDKVLGSNNLLAQNFTLYAVGRYLKENGFDLIAYSLAYGEDGTREAIPYFGQIFKDAWRDAVRFEEIPESDPTKMGWFLVVGKNRFPLPTPTDLHENKMTYRTDFYRLLDLRDRVLTALVDAKVNRELNESSPQTLTKFREGVVRAMERELVSARGSL